MSESSKRDRERRIFIEFIEKAQLSVDVETIESRCPPEPDILCWDKAQGFVAFELVELFEPQIAKALTKAAKADHSPIMWCSDPTRSILLSKLGKFYATNYPAELICCTPGRLVSPDDQIIDVMQEVLDNEGAGSFRRIWLLGEEVCQMVRGSAP
jgi:hypothetical protein